MVMLVNKISILLIQQWQQQATSSTRTNNKNKLNPVVSITTPFNIDDVFLI